MTAGFSDAGGRITASLPNVGIGHALNNTLISLVYGLAEALLRKILVNYMHIYIYDFIFSARYRFPSTGVKMHMMFVVPSCSGSSK